MSLPRFAAMAPCARCRRETPHTRHGKCGICGQSSGAAAAKAAKRSVLGDGRATHRLLVAVADALCSLWIRALRGACERCSKSTGLQWAHGITRKAWPVRWEPANAFCLCAGCHIWFTPRHEEWREFMVARLGQAGYDALVLRSRARGRVDVQLAILDLQQRLDALEGPRGTAARSAARRHLGRIPRAEVTA